MFHNSDKAKGYDYAQHEIEGARAFASAESFRASVAANRAATANHALAHTVDTLHAALAAETERGAFYEAEANKLAGALTEILPNYKRLIAANEALQAELARAREAIHELESQLPPLPDEDIPF